MTKRKPRDVTIHCPRIHVSGFGGFEQPICELLEEGSWFGDDDHPKIVAAIFDALTRFDLGKKGNPDRQRTALLRKDREELIGCLQEIGERLYPHYVSEPLWTMASAEYRPHERGKPTLRDETADLLLRLNHLRELFSHCEIPTPSRTNPGKPERDDLIQSLRVLFEQHHQPADDYASEHEQRVALNENRREFVTGVMRVFQLLTEEDAPARFV